MARHFTKQEIEEIRRQLATYGVRDSEFPEATTVSSEDEVMILQDEKNKRLDVGKIEDKIYTKIHDEGIDGKVLSDNNYTTGEKNKLANIQNGAQVNVIEQIKQDGVIRPINNKSVNIDLSDFVHKNLVPAAASPSNKLADKKYVHDEIITSAATFRGTSPKNLTEEQFLAWADTREHDLNDYVYWDTIDDNLIPIYKRYKWDNHEWVFEYVVNNSDFTDAQLAAINSGIDTTHVDKLDDLPTRSGLTAEFAEKQDVIEDLDEIRQNAETGGNAYHLPVSGIPSTDLSEGVNSSLAKAESAIQDVSDKISSDDIDDVIELTQEEFDALATKDPRTLYIVSDSEIESDHVGIASLVQTTVAATDEGINVWTCTLTNNQTFTLQVKNGSKGTSGYSGAAGELEVVNSLDSTDDTAALAASQGKVLDTKITQLGQYSRSQRIIGEGKNGPLVYSVVRFVRSQSSYRVYVLTPDWEVTFQGSKLTIGVENVTGERTNKVTVYYNSVVKSYYDVMTDDDTIALYIGVRAENGKAIDFLVEDYDAGKDWGILYDKNNAYVTRVLTGVTDPTDNPNGVRIRIVMPVKSGMKTWAKTTDPLGLNCVITPSFAQAIRVSPEDAIEAVSSGYTAGYDEKTIQHDGYMTLSLTNGSTPITDARKKEMLNALSFCCGEGTMYDNTTIEHRHTDEILNLNNETDALSDTVDTIDDYNNTLRENFIKNGLYGSIDTVIIPSVAQTYNGWFRSGETTNFHDGNEKRLLYYPEVYVKGGELVSVKYSGRNAIRVYELPYRKLGSSPFLTYSTANDIIAYHDLVNNTSSSYTGEVSFKLSDKCFRLGFVLGSTQNVAINPSEITDEITEVTLPVIATSVLNIANNDFKLKLFIERVAQAKFVAPSGTFTKSLGLIHFSDIHGDQEAADTINAYKKTIYDYVDDMLCTGDSVHYYADGAGNYPHGSVWWKETSNLADKSLFILGNHDSATTATTEYDQIEDSAAWDGKGKDWCYETYFAPYIEQLGYVMPSGYDDPTSANYHACYWHKDYTTQKIRVIGLDCLHRFDGVIDPATGAITTAGVKWTTNEQELWLIAKLNETLDSNNPAYGFSVLVACHYPIDNFNGNNEEWNDTNHRFTYNTNALGGRVMNHRTNDVVAFHNIKALSYNAEVKFNMRNRIDNGYSQGDPYPNYIQGATNNVGEILNAWIGRGGKMIAWLCGHTHNDYMWYSTKYPNILCIVIDQAGWLRPYGSGDRSEGLLSRTCANYYAFDTQNGLIKIVRIGYNMNKYLVSHEYLCYDYINRKVLNEG